MPNNAAESWLKFLNPESLKQNLVQSALYIACWEMLKEGLVDQVRDFYTHEWDGTKGIPSPNYKKEVLGLDKDPLIASALWFRNQNALTDNDINAIRGLRNHRNEIAHELPKFIGTAEAQVRLEYLDVTYAITVKVDQWWIQNIEIPTNPEFDDKTLTQQQLNEVASMRMVLMRLLISVARGQDDELRFYYEEMKKHVEATRRTSSEE